MNESNAMQKQFKINNYLSTCRNNKRREGQRGTSLIHFFFKNTQARKLKNKEQIYRHQSYINLLNLRQKKERMLLSMVFLPLNNYANIKFSNINKFRNQITSFMFFPLYLSWKQRNTSKTLNLAFNEWFHFIHGQHNFLKEMNLQDNAIYFSK